MTLVTTLGPWSRVHPQGQSTRTIPSTSIEFESVGVQGRCRNDVLLTLSLVHFNRLTNEIGEESHHRHTFNDVTIPSFHWSNLWSKCSHKWSIDLHGVLCGCVWVGRRILHDNWNYLQVLSQSGEEEGLPVVWWVCVRVHTHNTFLITWEHYKHGT